MSKKLIVALSALVVIAVGSFTIAMASNSSSETTPGSLKNHHTIKFPGPYSGMGNKHLGTIVIPSTGAELVFKCLDCKRDKMPLMVTQMGVSVSGQNGGDRFVAAGTYRNVSVLTQACWSIKITKRLTLR